MHGRHTCEILTVEGEVNLQDFVFKSPVSLRSSQRLVVASSKSFASFILVAKYGDPPLSG